MKQLALLFLTCILGGCQPDRPPTERPDPAVVLQHYQSHIDSNRFAAAQELSTPAEQERIALLAQILAGEDPDSTLLHTRFLATRCEIQEDTALCYCEMEDDYERYEQVFRLVWRQGQWLVDAPDEEIFIEEKVIDSLIH